MVNPLHDCLLSWCFAYTLPYSYISLHCIVITMAITVIVKVTVLKSHDHSTYRVVWPKCDCSVIIIIDHHLEV